MLTPTQEASPEVSHKLASYTTLHRDASLFLPGWGLVLSLILILFPCSTAPGGEVFPGSKEI